MTGQARTHFIADTDPASKQDAFAVAAVFSLFYLFTLSRNLSLGHDSAEYFKNIVAGGPYFHPHHLFYEPLSYLWLSGLRKVFPEASLVVLTISLNNLVGGALLGVFFQTLRARLYIPRVKALCVTALAGFSFGVWAYATTVEVCLIPIFFIFIAFYKLSDPEGATRNEDGAALIGALHGLAMIFHQIHFLFGFVVIYVFMTNRAAPFTRRLSHIGAYLLAGSLIVIVGYFIGAAQTEVLGSVAEFKAWFFNYAAKEEYYSRPFWESGLKTLAGWGRAFVNGYFIFGLQLVFDYFAAPFISAQSDKTILFSSADRFFYLNGAYPDPVLYLICLFALGVIAFIGLCVFRRARGKIPFSTPEQYLLICALPYMVFFFFWEPLNPEFHILQLLIFLALFVAPVSVALSRIAVAVGALFFVNGFGHAFPAASLEYDLYYQSQRIFNYDFTQSQAVITGSDWIYGNYLTLYRPEAVRCAVAHLNCGEFLNKARAEGRNLYIHRDACVAAPFAPQAAAVLDLLNAYCPEILERDRAYMKEYHTFPPPKYSYYRLPD